MTMTTNDIHHRLIELTALAGVLAESLLQRHVHQDDRSQPDLSAVAMHLSAQLARLTDQVEGMA